MVLALHRRTAILSGQYAKLNLACRQFCRPKSRALVTLAIETSCDDTSVAVAELVPTPACLRLKVHFHEKVTANNDAYGGINPLVALESHHANLAPLLKKALAASPRCDLVAATRGPGMRSNLSVGLNTGKGLACAWNVPFIGVHHMQAHALTPRLVSLTEEERLESVDASIKPEFPFLSILVSGGHSMLIDSTSLTEHAILAETQDIALGDCLDKAAREILPPELLKTPYGKSLEDFAFPRGEEDYNYTPPRRRQDELESKETLWRWVLSPPLSNAGSGKKSTRRMIYSFAGLLTQLQRFVRFKVDGDGNLTNEPRLPHDLNLDERRVMAREIQRVAFEHLASRVALHLSSAADPLGVSTVVVSGGVAANRYLSHVLRSFLDVRGYKHIPLAFPPISLCTDNALMIAWAAMEMYRAGYQSSLDIAPIRKWSMDSNAEDGGILGAGGWTQTTDGSLRDA